MSGSKKYFYGFKTPLQNSESTPESGPKKYSYGSKTPLQNTANTLKTVGPNLRGQAWGKVWAYLVAAKTIVLNMMIRKWPIIACGWLVIAFIFWNSRQNSQITVARHELVTELPAFVSRLSRVKTVCEGRAQYAIEVFREQKIGRNRLFEGRKLYDDTRAEFNGCIDYMRAALTRRFVDGDSAHIKEELGDGMARMAIFLGWVNSIDPLSQSREAGAKTGPSESPFSVDSIIGIVGEVLGRIDDRNDRALIQLRDDLESCRLREWSGLSK